MIKQVDSITIHIPILPDRRLGSNVSRCQHWGTKAKAKTALVNAILGGIRAALQNAGGLLDFVLFEDAELDITIVTHDRRRIMDRSNTVECLKFAFDSLEGKIITNDRNLRITSVEWVKDTGRPEGIIFEVRRL